jgi:hypothetical protein
VADILDSLGTAAVTIQIKPNELKVLADTLRSHCDTIEEACDAGLGNVPGIPVMATKCGGV